MLNIITCCNDGRLNDLRRLHRSIEAQTRDYRLRVIPFNEDVAQTTALAADIGAEMQPRDPIWTDLGRRLFHGYGHYRPGVARWEYFHKLNMFNNVIGPTLYLDVNCVLLSGEALPPLERFDILFHSAAMSGRNITENGAFIRRMDPAIREGCNFGHCVFGPTAARTIRQFAAILPGFHREFLGPAPEQSFVTYAIAFMGLRCGLLRDVDATIAPTNNPEIPVIHDADGGFRYERGKFKGQRLISAKRPGVANPGATTQALFSRFD